MKGKIRQHLHIMGADGARMLLLSLIVIGVTGGLSWIWQYRKVWNTARKVSAQAKGELIIVLGMKLRNAEPAELYVQRLDRAVALLRSHGAARVLIVGGKTGTSPISEAEAGKQFLVRAGVDAGVILKEEASRHTLENLQQARALFADLNAPPPVLVTSRFHLARTREMANGLGIEHTLCAAEDKIHMDLSTLFAMAREAFFLNWYAVGRNWSRWTRNAASLQRIT